MKRISHILSIVLIVSLLFGGIVSSVAIIPATAAPGPVQVTIDAPETAAVDTDFTVVVNISHVGPLGEPQYGGRLTQAQSSFPQHFDDAAADSVWDAPTLTLTNEDLIKGDWAKGPIGTGEATWMYPVVPSPYYFTGCLAKGWEIRKADTLVFHIQQGIRFHNKPPTNGREVNANDVVYSLERLWQTSTSYHYRYFPWDTHILSIKALDDYTVEIKCYPDKLPKVFEWASSVSKIVPREVIEMYGDLEEWSNSCGTGPFMLTQYESGTFVTFTRNPNYWMKDPVNPKNSLPYLDEVRWLTIPDVATRLVAFRTGSLDMVRNLPWHSAESLMGTNPELEYLEYLNAGTLALFMRVDKPPLNDIRVRQALSMAIDRQAIIDTYYGGHAKKLAWPVMPTPEYRDIYTPLQSLPKKVGELYNYNPTRAKELLAEASYPNGFATSVVVSSDQNLDIPYIIQEYFADIGVDMEIQVMEASKFREYIIKEKIHEHMAMYPVSSINPYGLLNFIPGGLLNLSIVDDQVINEATYKMITAYAFEPEKRRLMKEIVPYILEQSYILVPPFPTSYTMWWPWVKGYHGEYSVGYFGATDDFSRYIWIDQEFKEFWQKMGYVPGLNVAQYNVSFDPSVLRLENVTSGQIDSTEIPVQFFQLRPGQYRIVQSLGNDTVVGSGYLSRLHFHVIGSECQSSQIELTNGLLEDLETEIPSTWSGDIVTIGMHSIVFPDPNLEAAVREAIGKLTGVLTNCDVLPLTVLDASNRGIVDLSGLEYCVNLQELDLRNNQISALSPLSGLNNLVYLYLRNNQIVDISPLSGLTNLISLGLGENNITDISHLSGLINLNWLYLFSNQITNISSLFSLTNLINLGLGNNNISDISSLSRLANLNNLYLPNNQISDIYPLLRNKGISSGDTVDIRTNPLSCESVFTYIPQLENRGVTVLADIPPSITNGTVTPVSGQFTTNFIYSVNYTSTDNNQPTSITVTFDGGTPNDMNPASGGDGDFTNGEIYEYTTTGDILGAGTSHTFQFAASDSVNSAICDIGIHNGPDVSSPPSDDSGGGGPSVSLPACVTSVSDYVTSNGVFRQDVTSKSGDGKFVLAISKGTVGKTQSGRRLSRLEFCGVGEPGPAVTTVSPLPPEGCVIIGLVYDSGPDGATFEPPITLTGSYDLAALDENIAEDELHLAHWDGTQWQPLESVVDTETATVSAEISHLTQFAMIGCPSTKPPSQPTPPSPSGGLSKPANFVISDLMISPGEVESGNEVDISVLVTNDGGRQGSHTVVLAIDGIEEASQEITLASGNSDRVSFTVVRHTVGSCDVDCDGEIGEFTIIAPPETTSEGRVAEILPIVETSTINWWIIIAIIIGFIVIAGLLFKFVFK